MNAQCTTVDCDYLGPRIAAAYLRVAGDEAAFIEANTAHAAPKLLAALAATGLAPSAVRWIIVTHAHLDHAGGAGALMAACPNATLVAHPRAARHLIDPARLVASATAVYGERRFAELYGTVEAIPAARVRTMEDGTTLDVGGGALRFLHVRGHANHHFAVHDEALDTVFTGDAFGLIYPRLQRAGTFAFPSTSPTDFDGAEAHAAVDRILALKTKTAHPTHFGPVSALAVIGAQLHRWLDVAEKLYASDLDEAAMEAALRREMNERAAAIGLTLDADDQAFLDLDIGLDAQGIHWAAQKRTAAK